MQQQQQQQHQQQQLLLLLRLKKLSLTVCECLPYNVNHNVRPRTLGLICLWLLPDILPFSEPEILKPTAVVTNPLTIAEVGQPVKLTCIIGGTPEPSVYWFKDLIQIKDLEKYPQNEPGLLEIPSVEKSDAGIYTCLAYNVFGQGRGDMNLTVVRGKAVVTFSYFAPLRK